MRAATVGEMARYHRRRNDHKDISDAQEEIAEITLAIGGCGCRNRKSPARLATRSRLSVARSSASASTCRCRPSARTRRPRISSLLDGSRIVVASRLVAESAAASQMGAAGAKCVDKALRAGPAASPTPTPELTMPIACLRVLGYYGRPPGPKRPTDYPRSGRQECAPGRSMANYWRARGL